MKREDTDLTKALSREDVMRAFPSGEAAYRVGVELAGGMDDYYCIDDADVVEVLREFGEAWMDAAFEGR